MSAPTGRVEHVAAKKTLVPWTRAKPAPVVVISGGESVLVRKAQDRIVAACRKHKDLETTHLDAVRYEAGDLAMAAAPSLFATRKLVIVDSVAQCGDDFLQDALAYVGEVNEDAVVLLKHSGGNRGSKLLTAIDKAGYPRIDAQVMKSESDRQDFALAEFKRAERTIEPPALAALMSALGADLSDRAAAGDRDDLVLVVLEPAPALHGQVATATGVAHVLDLGGERGAGSDQQFLLSAMTCDGAVAA